MFLVIVTIVRSIIVIILIIIISTILVSWCLRSWGWTLCLGCRWLERTDTTTIVSPQRSGLFSFLQDVNLFWSSNIYRSLFLNVHRSSINIRSWLARLPRSPGHLPLCSRSDCGSCCDGSSSSCSLCNVSSDNSSSPSGSCTRDSEFDGVNRSWGGGAR